MWSNARCSFLAVLALAALHSSTAVNLNDIKALTYNDASKDSVLWRAWRGVQLAYGDGTAKGMNVSNLENVNTNATDTKVQVASDDIYDAIVVFQSNKTFGNLNTYDEISLLNGSAGLTAGDIRILRDVANTLRPFRSDLQSKMKKVMKNNDRPITIMVTGAGSGGTLAVVGGVYAAVWYPSAHIFVETFNMTIWPGNNRFNWTYGQLIDQFYLWPPQSVVESIGKGDLAKKSLKDVNERLDHSTSALADNSLADEVAEVLRIATTIVIKADNGTDVSKLDAPHNATGNSTDANAVVSAYTTVNEAWLSQSYNEQLNDTVQAWLESRDNCPLVLCKTRLPLLLAGAIYPTEKGQPSPIYEALPNATKMLAGENSADAVLGWDNKTRTAFVIFQGSEDVQDFVADVQIVKVDYPVKNDVYKWVFDKPEVAYGFREQFLELTSDAEDANKIDVQLKKLMGNSEPRLIIICGHSLGGALTSLAGPYMYSLWPRASILSVTSGSPRVGADPWVFMYQSLMGRQWRFVQEADVVPALPPSLGFTHVGKEIWIHAGEIILGYRDDNLKLNAQDHNSYTYALYPIEAENTTTPAWFDEL